MDHRAGKHCVPNDCARFFKSTAKEVRAVLETMEDKIEYRKSANGRTVFGYPREKIETPIAPQKYYKPFTPMTPEVYAKRIDTKGVVSI
jgi:hypothetical protein